MQLGFGLHQQQTQKLVMTPALRQAITILQYPAIELTEYLHQQMIDNPVLDLDEKELERFDYLYRNMQSYSASNNHYNEDQERNIWDTILHEVHTLEDYLNEQVSDLTIEAKERRNLQYLIGCLDEAGYLTISIEEAAHCSKQEISDMQQALSLLHSLEPVGVGATNLRECLLLQLQQMEAVDEKAVFVVMNFLEELATKNFAKIAEQMNISTVEVQQIADFIATLNPKPAAGFGNGPAKYIYPDVMVDKVDGEWIVIVNDKLVPRLNINNYYHQYLMTTEKLDETTKYIKEKWNAAIWLVKSIEQRKQTLYKVTNAIIEHQKDFFESRKLKPLTLKQIADDAEVHESTVSRSINQKYVQTPLGIFELKYFFSSGLSTKDGNSTSVENVKKRIKQLVEQENKQKPLSDQKLSVNLQKEGIEISRRTVAKYREELNIASSAKRKRYD